MRLKDDFMKKTPVVVLGALICCLLWGSAFPCIKLGYSWMNIEATDFASQILYAGLRFTIAGILAIIIGSLLQRKPLIPGKSTLGKIAWLSLFQTILQYLFFYIGLAHTSGVKASIIEGTNVFVAVIVASLIFHQEKLSLRKISGCVVGFIGVIIVNMTGDGLGGGLTVIGEGFIFFSTVAYAVSSVYLKRFSKTENPVLLSGWQFVFGGIVMSILGFAIGGRITYFPGKAVAMLIYLGFVSAIAYSLWGILLKYNPISKVAVFGFMNPVFGVILSAILLDENGQLGLKSLLALLLVGLGIYIVNKVDENE